MSERWIVSWFWTWGRVHGEPPGEPQWVPEEMADALGRLAVEAFARDPVEKLPAFLSLSHARVMQTVDLAAMARVEYRVAPSVRFPHGAVAHGVARRANEHVRTLEQARRLPSTRGPFHLSEVLAQAGLAILTARTDVLLREESPRVGTYLALAVTHSGGPLEPMRIGLFDVATSRVFWTTDDVLSRAWHAPLAGGELLTVLPPLGALTSPVSMDRAVTRPLPAAEPASEPRRVAATMEMDTQPSIARPPARDRASTRD